MTQLLLEIDQFIDEGKLLKSIGRTVANTLPIIKKISLKMKASKNGSNMLNSIKKMDIPAVKKSYIKDKAIKKLSSKLETKPTTRPINTRYMMDTGYNFQKA